jgi:hypothetical protein
MDAARLARCGKRVKACKRGLAHHQVAGQVVAAQGQGAQHVIVAPEAGVVAQLQLGVGVGKSAPHEALGAHVVQKPGQAVKALGEAVFFVHPHSATGQRHHAPERAGLALRVDAHDGHTAAHIAHGARQHIALLAGSTHFLHLARLNERSQRARDGGLAHPQQVLKLGAAERTALAAKCLQNAGREVWRGGHE